MTYPNIYAAQVGPLALATLDANFLWATDIQSQAITANAGGTADAITATYIPAVTALINGLTLYVRASASNATTTPQFSPNGLTARTIVKATGSLVVGDIAGAGHWLQLTYDTTLVAWVLSNPADTQGGNLQATSINGGQLAGLRNRIINGDMRVAQRGSVTSSSAYTLDRWIVNSSGASVTTVQGGVSFTGTTLANALTIQGAASVTGTGIQQRIESLNSRDLAGKTVTISFWTYQDTGATTTPLISLYRANTLDTFSGITLDSASQSYSVPTATWTFVSKTFTVSTSAIYGLMLDISSVGAILGGKTAYFANVQLEVGSVATTFEQRPYGMELALCQRYLPVVQSTISGQNPIGLGQAISTTQSLLHYKFTTTPRVTPTSIALTTVGNYLASQSNGTVNACSSVTLNYANADSATLVFTTTGLVAGSASYCWISGISERLLFNGCEL